MGNTTVAYQCSFCLKSSNERKGTYQNCKVCNKCFCNYCNENPIFLKDDAEKYIHENGDVIMTLLCPSCFKNQSTIDFNQRVEIIGKQNSKNLLWIHGAMSCRKMFKVHAEILANYGYRSILIDLPAHGTEMDVPLTIDNCVNHIYKMRQEYCTNTPVAIGGSLGGYMLMQTIRKYPSKTVFSGVAICMASQNVGLGRSLKASLGLFMIDKSTKLLSTQRMGKAMLTMAKNINKQISAQFGKSGLFFNQCSLRTAILQQTNSIQGIKNYQGNILFLNGQNDYMDSLQLWSSVTKNTSQSKIYKNSDHFFSHDKTYLKQFAEDIRVFAQQVLNRQQQNKQ